MPPSADTSLLSPASGIGLGRMLAADLLARENFVETLANSFMEGLVASKRYWVKDTKGGGHWEDVPDYRARLDAANAILANIEGEPIKRTVSATVPATPGTGSREDEAIDLIAGSKALQGALERQLAKARRKAQTELVASVTQVPSVNLDE